MEIRQGIYFVPTIGDDLTLMYAATVGTNIVVVAGHGGLQIPDTERRTWHLCDGAFDLYNNTMPSPGQVYGREPYSFLVVLGLGALLATYERCVAGQLSTGILVPRFTASAYEAIAQSSSCGLQGYIGFVPPAHGMRPLRSPSLTICGAYESGSVL